MLDVTFSLKGLKTIIFKTTNTSQHVEFFHSLIFHLFWLLGGFSKRWWGKNQNFMLIRFLNAGM